MPLLFRLTVKNEQLIEVSMMSEKREDKRFATSEELLQYLKDRVDDIDSVVIPVQEQVQVMDAQGRPKHIAKGMGAWIKLCDGRSVMISRDDAAMLINDGVLQRLR